MTICDICAFTAMEKSSPGLGLAAYTDNNPLVSSPLGFSLSAGMNIGERFGFQWRHFSNAGIEQPNMGQDVLLASWRL